MGVFEAIVEGFPDDQDAFRLADAGALPRKRRMTRPAIERCIKIFIVALIATFGWTLTQVAGMLGCL